MKKSISRHETKEDAHKLDSNSPPSAPRWVKVFGVIALVLVLLIIIMHLTGYGFGGHTPSIGHGMH